ncbi:MAG: winged helix-turn-helix domain-containing protein [Pseudobdellovibrionaceae bacterium]
MLEGLVGNQTAEKVLLYIVNYGEGHTSGIAQTFDIPKSQVRKQLIRLENGGILIGRNVGNLRMFQINPRCSYKKELESLFEKVLSLVSDAEKEKFYRQRRRPRRTGKDL